MTIYQYEYLRPSVRNRDLRFSDRVMAIIGKFVLSVKTGKRERNMWSVKMNQESSGEGWKLSV